MRNYLIFFFAAAFAGPLAGQCDNLKLNKAEMAYMKSLFYRTLKPGEKSIPMKIDPDEADYRLARLELEGFHQLAKHPGNVPSCLEYLWKNGKMGLLDPDDPDQKYYVNYKGDTKPLFLLYCFDGKKAIALVKESLEIIKPKALSVKPISRLYDMDRISFARLDEYLRFISRYDQNYADSYNRALAEHDVDFWGKRAFYRLAEINPDDQLVKKIINTEKAQLPKRKQAADKLDKSRGQDNYLRMMAYLYFCKKDAESIYHQLQTHPYNPPLYFQYLHRLHRDDLIDKYATTVTNPKSKSEITRNIAIYKNGSYDKALISDAVSAANGFACPAK